METIDPKSEVDASLSRKKASIEEMLREHGVSTGGKKIRQLMELDDITLGTYMLGLQIGKCCQVLFLVSHDFIKLSLFQLKEIVKFDTLIGNEHISRMGALSEREK